MSREVHTQCPYCGVGCGLVATVQGDRLESVKGDPRHPVNHGATCRKPLGLPAAVHAPDRALTPLWRDSADARWVPIGWRSAVPRVANRLRAIADGHGPDAIAFYISGQLLTEDYYVVNKLAKGFLATNNVDSNSRLCMSSAVSGYVASLGSDGPPASYADIARTDCLLLVGTNTAECHPIVWAKIRARQAEGAKLIVVDPRRTPTAEAADLHLAVRPGADLPLLAAMIGVLDAQDMVDRAFVEHRTEGWAEALAVARDWSPGRAAEATGIPAEQIVAAARAFGVAPRAMALWSMGVNQSTVGTLKNRAITNLCLATGNIGRPGTGPLSLTGQPNAMGGRESGGLSTLLPGYRSVSDPGHRAEMRRLWDIPAELPGIQPTPGLASTELVEALEDGRVRAVWIVATNPVVSQPDARRFATALRRAELVIAQDAYHPTETSSLAHVLLPAAQWPEKTGTMTNSERRVGLVRAAIAPPGHALPDWEIFARVGRALGHRDAFGWRTVAEVFDEYVATTAGRLCDQTGLSHARLAQAGPLQWPIPARGPNGDEHDGTERLYGSLRFPTPSGRARFGPTPHSEPADAPDDVFPLVLNTGRVAHQWHTMTRTAKDPGLLSAEPEPFLEIHPADARRARVGDGDRVEVRSRRGRATLLARVTDAVREGTVFAPFHWGAIHLPPGAGALNAITARELDPVSRQPELKACAVRVETGRAPAGAPRDRLLVVGTGMSAMATVEALLAHGDADRWQVTMIGAEPVAPYNRVLLSKLLAGAVAEPGLELQPAEWLAARRIDVRTGRMVRALDLAARNAELDDGESLTYDRLVLATGSRPVVPPIVGADCRGVHAFRTLADAHGILERAGASRRAVVIGGGLLGLEAARGLRQRGLQVTVVHLAGHLMEQQLDGIAGSLLARAMAGLGVETRLGASTEMILGGDDRVTLVGLADGTELPADMVVLATGVRPEVELARAAGVEVERGIVVDDELRTSAPGVHAVGECAQHRGVVYGLWAPLLEMAKAAGASLAGQPAAFCGVVPATTLKVAGIELFCCGRTTAERGDEEVLALDSRHGRYRKLVLHDGRLAGAILLGDLREARLLRDLLKTGVPVPEELTRVTRPIGGVPHPAPDDPAATVCSCMNVSVRDITTAMRSSGLRSVDEVARHTRASTGCGGCKLDLRAIVERHNAATAESLRDVRPVLPT